MQDLQGRVVLVTGGATGIGGAASRAFAAAGAHVAVHYFQGIEAAETLVAEITAAGGKAAAFQANLVESAACAKLVADVAAHFGGLDVLINNAGGLVERRTLDRIDDDFISAVFDLNVRQVVHLSREALPWLKARGGGSIINVSSIAARMGGGPGASQYAGAKAFISNMTRALARELAPDNIRVNAVSPGTITTAFHERHSTPEKLEATRLSIPALRLGTAEDCAGTFLYLASDQMSGYVTGQIVEVNGGQFVG